MCEIRSKSTLKKTKRIKMKLRKCEIRSKLVIRVIRRIYEICLSQH